MTSDQHPPPESHLDLRSVLRLLRASRRLVAVGVAVAALAATLVMYHVSIAPPGLEPRGDSIGVASSQVLVDSRSSQSVDLGEESVLIDIPGLIARARLLANLIATSPLRDQIARRAGIDADRFLASAPSVGFDSPKPDDTAGPAGGLNVMNVTFNESLPIVTINAEASDEKTAARITGAAASELGDYLRTLTAQDRVLDAHQIVVKRLGGADSTTVRHGPQRLTAFFVFVFLLGLWCSTIVAVARLRLLRKAGSGGALPRVPEFVSLTPPRPPSAARVPADPLPVAALPEWPERPERPRRGVSA